ncbi:MAG: excinuclease ABC subunit UvrA [Muribaculaceae bacterium]|nr:excinuclease ABC subunit UvrA [Muribaculaceae bacterium]
MNPKEIIVKGARVNNLKNVDVRVPRNQFVVITGLSGSGKSSLAFDTLYAEGQRRYVESLSSYARQFLGRMAKPECDFIRGLPPAIAIEQKVNTRNSRSTVGTSTEIYDYLRLLFSRVGKTFSPVSGQLVKKHTSADVVRAISALPQDTRYALLTEVIVPPGRALADQLAVLQSGGYSRLERDGEFVPITQAIALVQGGEAALPHSAWRLLIDRLAASHTREEELRVLDSLQTAFHEGHGECILMVWNADGTRTERRFSKRFEADGITFAEPTDLMFNFNNPVGACPTCEGFGRVVGIDENLVVPDKTLSVYDDAVMCWRGPVMGEVKREFIHVAARHDFPIHTPYLQLTRQQKDLLWHGDGKGWTGIDGFFEWVKSKSHNIQYRVMLARYRGKTLCPTCHGSRLKPEAAYVRVGGKSIGDLVQMPVSELAQWFSQLTLDGEDAVVARRLLTEIVNRLNFLLDVGLGYLTLDRLSSTLSGGESQRINLATSLGSALVGSLYILDEPSIGLHARDTDRLIHVLHRLRDLGNTVVVVEHDEEIMRAADYLIDIGPEAGRHGGEVVFQGALGDLPAAQRSYTARYLTHELEIPLPKHRRKWNNYIEITGAAENNLRGIDVRFPLGVMTVVTGVSGSGKSTLVTDILYRTLARHFDQSAERPGTHSGLRGDLKRIEHVELVDQNPIGKSSRSNPATYLKAFDEIRQLFSEQQLAKQMGYGPGFFSFNTPGGRCEECKGEGTITIEMQFMADITLPCEACHGKRYSRNALDVLYRGKSVSDILDMTVNQAIEFFSAECDTTAQAGKGRSGIPGRIIKRLKPLQDVGLGYIKLGQSSSTLSGGENQRVKLAYYLAGEHQSPTIYIFDEPTTGLHFHDINTLLRSLGQLIDRGHTVVVIEHNMDVIKCADHIIDLGPEGGDAGGTVVATGTPEQIAANPASHTGQFLKAKMERS